MIQKTKLVKCRGTTFFRNHQKNRNCLVHRITKRIICKTLCLACIIHTKTEKVLNLLQISKHITIFAIRNKKPKKELFHEQK